MSAPALGGVRLRGRRQWRRRLTTVETVDREPVLALFQSRSVVVAAGRGKIPLVLAAGGLRTGEANLNNDLTDSLRPTSSGVECLVATGLVGVPIGSARARACRKWISVKRESS